MYLKSLFIHGFKSFPSSVTLEFNKGITSVVGPNGSGKSNVSDAIRWVLGEQSAKNLRGQKMEDVIFFGTAQRKSVGYCEVSMTLDNKDRLIPLDFEEIKITRRQTRSGESTYQINGVNSRLKDILELFMDTGIGKEGYSIIGQGRIEEILKSKSDERRLLFEEATGIVKYKKRRTDAKSKLDKHKDNLIRVNDILKELEVQVMPLKLQSEKAKQYILLYENKKNYQISLFLIDVKQKEELEKKYIETIKEYKENIKEKEDEYKSKEQTISSLKNEQEDILKTIKSLNDDLSNGKEYFLSLTHSIKLNEEKISNIDDNLARIRLSVYENKSLIISKEDEIKTEKINYNNVEQNIENFNNELKAKENEIKLLQEGLGSNDLTLKSINSEILQISETIAKLESSISSEEELYENLNLETELTIAEIKDLKTQLSNLNEIIHSSEELSNKIELELNTLKDDIKIYEDNVKNLKEEQLNLSERKNLLTDNFYKKNASYTSLLNAQKSYLGYYDSVKFVLSKVDNSDSRFKGVLGTIGNIFTTKKEYELALETTLSGQVQSIVTDNEDTAKNIINILRNENKGRCTFLPLTTVKTYNDVNENMKSEKGVIGFFVDLVNYDVKFEPIANSLLQKTLVIDTIENAINFNKKYKNRIKIVTLSGDILSTTGSISGGSQKKNSSNIFSNKRNLAEIETEVTQLKDELKSLDESLKKVIEKSDYYRNNLSITRNIFTEKQQLLTNEKNKYDTSKVKYQYTSETLLKIENKDTLLLNQIEEKNIYIKKLYKDLADFSINKNKLNEKLLEFTKNLDSNKSKKDIEQNILMDINVKITKEIEKKNNILQNITRLEKEILVLEKEIELENTTIAKEVENKDNFNKIIIDLITKKDNVFANNESISKNIELKESVLTQKHNNQNILENSNKELLIELNELSKALTKDELYLNNVSNEIQKLYDEMWNEYELTYQTCLEFKTIELPYQELKKLYAETTKNLKQLGNVNINAIEQYKEVSERYEFLLAQKEDAIEAEKKLDIVIKDLTNLMEEQFINQFEIIKNNFKAVFEEMFGGGTSDLVLTEPEDVLNSPIEILAEPPGKKLKSLTLMSGGEKSLTAICLLFGILKMKPSPFCVLDEIEAALDDANVDRYAAFLSTFKQETQFILITHRKGTMVIADTLYGVTMEEMGISKLVSVKLEDYN